MPEPIEVTQFLSDADKALHDTLDHAAQSVVTVIELLAGHATDLTPEFLAAGWAKASALAPKDWQPELQVIGAMVIGSAKAGAMPIVTHGFQVALAYVIEKLKNFGLDVNPNTSPPDQQPAATSALASAAKVSDSVSVTRNQGESDADFQRRRDTANQQARVSASEGSAAGVSSSGDRPLATSMQTTSTATPPVNDVTDASPR